MHRFLRELITEWRRLELPVKDAAIVVAVSGGADSVSLLLALAQLKEKKKLDVEFVAAHFNHGLRAKESDRDEAFVKKLAARYGFKFESGRWKPKDRKAGGGENLEQSARLARYEFLGETAIKHNAQVVLTAHTMNDQAETFLMRLVRGSGLDGLGAMKSSRELNGAAGSRLVRPLLRWAGREDTEDLCREAGVKYRNDAMNRDEAFLRVKVRKKVLPLLAEINPAIIPALAKMADSMRSETDDLNAAAAAALDQAKKLTDDSLDVKALAAMSPALRMRVLRLWLGELRGGLRRLDMEHFTAVERLVLSGKGAKTTQMPKGESVSVSKGRLIFKKT